MTNEEKKALIKEQMKHLMDSFKEKMPREVMKQPLGTKLMFDTIISLLFRLRTAMNLDRQQVAALIQSVADELDEKDSQATASRLMN